MSNALYIHCKLASKQNVYATISFISLLTKLCIFKYLLFKLNEKYIHFKPLNFTIISPHMVYVNLKIKMHKDR